MTTAQPFPAGAVMKRGHCGGFYCRDVAGEADVVACRVGPSWREAVALDLCADCLADFAMAPAAFAGFDKVIAVDFPGGFARATDLPVFHAYALGEDGLFHEVTGDLPE